MPDRRALVPPTAGNSVSCRERAAAELGGGETPSPERPAGHIPNTPVPRADPARPSQGARADPDPRGPLGRRLGAQTPETRALAGLRAGSPSSRCRQVFSPGASVLGLQTATSRGDAPVRTFLPPLCVSSSSLLMIERAPALTGPAYFNRFFKGAASKDGHVVRYLGVGLQYLNLGDTTQSITRPNYLLV